MTPSHDALTAEREWSSGIISKGTMFRIIVTGHIGEREIEWLIKKLNIDKELLAEAAPPLSDESPTPAKEG